MSSAQIDSLRRNSEAFSNHRARPPLLQGRGEPLAQYLLERRSATLMQLAEVGAILFRGFAALTVPDFHAAITSLVDNLMGSHGEHNRIGEYSHVFSPVKYPPERNLLWHNENSFNRCWPHLIAFGCVRPATAGGQTLLVDARTLLASLDASVVEEFQRKGIMYIRRMGLGIDRDWRDVLAVASKDEAEAKCNAEGMSFSWLAGDVLETRCIRGATTVHPLTHTECWFNQVQHWHPHCLESEVREYLTQVLSKDRWPRDCHFGDGSSIPDEVVDHILQKYREAELRCACQAGDVLILDNVATAHGRAAYRGPREIMVMMGTLQQSTVQLLRSGAQ